jgi:hypothetical protein
MAMSSGHIPSASPRHRTLIQFVHLHTREQSQSQAWAGQWAAAAAAAALIQFRSGRAAQQPRTLSLHLHAERSPALPAPLLALLYFLAAMSSSSPKDGDDQRANPIADVAFESASAGHSDRHGHPSAHAHPQPHPITTPREQGQQGEPEHALRALNPRDDPKDDAGAVELAPLATAPISSPAAAAPRPVVVHLAEPVVAAAAEAEQKQQPAAPLDVLVDVDPSVLASSPASSSAAAEPGAAVPVASKSDREAAEFAALAAELKGSLPRGLTDTEAADRLLKYGRNEITEKEKNPLLEFCLFFWGPLAWAIGQPHRDTKTAPPHAVNADVLS